MVNKNNKLESVLSEARSRLKSVRNGIKSLRPSRSLDSLWAKGKTRADRFTRSARRRAQLLAAQTTKRFERAKREAGAQVERFQIHLIESVGIATKPQLDELDHRISKLAKKLNSVVTTADSAANASRT